MEIEDSGYAVSPKTNCQHITIGMINSLKLIIAEKQQLLFSEKCKDCDNTQENWICLECSAIYCSRYIKSHMLNHNAQTKHTVALSLADLSFWCYDCDSYITNFACDTIRKNLSDIKFKQIPKQQEPQVNIDSAFEVQGYAVEPKTNCKHITIGMINGLKAVIDLKQKAIFSEKCKDCGNAGENWICLECKMVYCSRYVKCHMVNHNAQTKHQIALSFSDLSFWCYECDSYITNFACDMIRRDLQEKKFPNQKPQQTYNIQSEEEKKEYFDTEQELDEKVTQLANFVKQSKHFIAFTGAGISTSTGIPDFRSGTNTKLKTGPGAWEQLATKYKPNQEIHRISALCAIPSPAHMGLVALEEIGLLKYLISQNTDGLHRRSQFPPNKLAELHGNSNLELCQKCKKKYLRDFNTASALLLTHTHDTGRTCDNPACKGNLSDTIINFGENLPQEELQAGFEHANKADLQETIKQLLNFLRCLCLGSSLRVTPAASMPKAVASNGKNLVIVNLQKTPLDVHAKIKINAYCDQVIELLLKKLGIKQKDFKLVRRVQIKKISQNELHVQGLDIDNLPYSLFKSVTLKINDTKSKLLKEQFIFKIPVNTQKIELIFEFQGHYDEPEAVIVIDLNQNLKNQKDQVSYVLGLDVQQLQWDIKQIQNL